MRLCTVNQVIFEENKDEHGGDPGFWVCARGGAGVELLPLGKWDIKERAFFLPWSTFWALVDSEKWELAQNDSGQPVLADPATGQIVTNASPINVVRRSQGLPPILGEEGAPPSPAPSTAADQPARAPTTDERIRAIEALLFDGADGSHLSRAFDEIDGLLRRIVALEERAAPDYLDRLQDLEDRLDKATIDKEAYSEFALAESRRISAIQGIFDKLRAALGSGM